MPLRVFLGNSCEKYLRFADHPSMSEHAFMFLNVVLVIDTSRGLFVALLSISLTIAGAANHDNYINLYQIIFVFLKAKIIFPGLQIQTMLHVIISLGPWTITCNACLISGE